MSKRIKIIISVISLLILWWVWYRCYNHSYQEWSVKDWYIKEEYQYLINLTEYQTGYQIWYYVDWKKEWLWTWYDFYNRVRFEKNYKNGELFWRSVEYDYDWSIAEERVYKDNGNVSRIVYLSDGEKCELSYENQEVVWVTSCYDRDWNLVSEDFEDNWETIKQVRYYSNGNIKELSDYLEWYGKFYSKEWELLSTVEYLNWEIYSWIVYNIEFYGDNILGYTSYKNWKEDWEKVSFNRDWSISSIDTYEDWKYINTEYVGTYY